MTSGLPWSSGGDELPGRRTVSAGDLVATPALAGEPSGRCLALRDASRSGTFAKVVEALDLLATDGRRPVHLAASLTMSQASVLLIGLLHRTEGA
jgi:hypothetical protein